MFKLRFLESDISRWAQEYSYTEGDAHFTCEVRPAVHARGHLTRPEFLAIRRWKTRVQSPSASGMVREPFGPSLKRPLRHQTNRSRWTCSGYSPESSGPRPRRCFTSATAGHIPSSTFVPFGRSATRSTSTTRRTYSPAARLTVVISSEEMLAGTSYSRST